MTQKEIEDNLLSIIKNYSNSEDNMFIADKVLDSQQLIFGLEYWYNHSELINYSAIVKVENQLDNRHAILLTASKTNNQSVVITIIDPLSDQDSMFKVEIEQLAQLLNNQGFSTNILYSGIQDKDYGTCADLSLILLYEVLEKTHGVLS